MTYGHPLLVFLEEEGAGFWLIRPEQPEADRFYYKSPTFLVAYGYDTTYRLLTFLKSFEQSGRWRLGSSQRGGREWLAGDAEMVAIR